MMWRVSAPFKGFKPSAAALGKAVTQAALLNSARCTLPHLPDFLTVSKQPFATFRSDTPCLPDLARVLCCLPPLVLQAVPARTICHAFKESTVVCHFGSTKPYPASCQTFFKGIGGTWATAHSILFTYCVFVHFGLGKSVWS